METYPLYMLDSAYSYVAREGIFKPGQDQPTPEETAAFIHKYGVCRVSCVVCRVSCVVCVVCAVCVVCVVCRVCRVCRGVREERGLTRARDA